MQPIDASLAFGKKLDTATAAGPEQKGSDKGVDQSAGQGNLKVGIDGQLGQWGAGQGQPQMMGAVGVGFDGSSVGFPNMGWNGPGDFNPMMNGMQTVMPNAGWGSFPNAMGK